ncbi:MAG: HEAT repeat domain-containing protein [Myxococcota bacterium]
MTAPPPRPGPPASTTTAIVVGGLVAALGALFGVVPVIGGFIMLGGGVGFAFALGGVRRRRAYRRAVALEANPRATRSVLRGAATGTSWRRRHPWAFVGLAVVGAGIGFVGFRLMRGLSWCGNAAQQDLLPLVLFDALAVAGLGGAFSLIGRGLRALRLSTPRAAADAEPIDAETTLDLLATSPDVEVRAAAVRHLAALEHVWSLPQLRSVASQDPDATVRALAAAAVVRIRSSMPLPAPGSLSLPDPMGGELALAPTTEP